MIRRLRTKPQRGLSRKRRLEGRMISGLGENHRRVGNGLMLGHTCVSFEDTVAAFLRISAIRPGDKRFVLSLEPHSRNHQ